MIKIFTTKTSRDRYMRAASSRRVQLSFTGVGGNVIGFENARFMGGFITSGGVLQTSSSSKFVVQVVNAGVGLRTVTIKGFQGPLSLALPFGTVLDGGTANAGAFVDSVTFSGTDVVIGFRLVKAAALTDMGFYFGAYSF